MNKSLKDKAVSGIAWTSVERIIHQVIQFVIGIAIARILSPKDYGIIGMTAIFLAVATVFIDSGFGSALIQKKDRNNTDFSTCFYFNLIVGLLLYSLLWLASPAIAEFYRTPILCDVLRVLGITLITNSLTISQSAKMTADISLNFISAVIFAV